MRSIFCISFFLHFAIYCRAQESFLPETQAKLLTKVAFRKFTGGVIVVRACIENTKDTLNFILDTGTNGISLDSTTCSLSNIKTTPSDISIIGVGGINKVSFIFDQKLYFPNLIIDKLNFHVSDLSMLSSAYGEKIDGMVFLTVILSR